MLQTIKEPRIQTKIERLRKERNAVILAHNYQRGEVQDIADFVGDSLDLSRKAAASDADVIVFCGVHFMAETAAILAKDKKVLLPDPDAGCPMADMVDAEGVQRARRENPRTTVVCYVNTTAEVKAESDLCCTSANAVEIVSMIPKEQEILFVPDRYLGGHVQEKTGRRMKLWPGFCPTHMRILPEHIQEKKAKYPDAEVLVHPECRPEVTRLADHVLSTGGICRHARETAASTLIIGTEIGIIHRLMKENPDKCFIPASKQAICPNMKLITLEKVLWALEDMQYVIEVSDTIRQRARMAVDRMVEVRL